MGLGGGGMKVGEGIWVGHDQDTLYTCMKLTKNKTNVWKSLAGWLAGWLDISDTGKVMHRGENTP